MRTLIIFVFVAVVFTSAVAQSSFPALLAEKPASEHQDKLMLFGQFVGSWTFDGVEYRDDGSRRTDKGEIYFHWVLQGRAIQDVFLETERSDSEPKMYGSTVRFYDPKSDSWWVTYIDPVFGVVRALTGRKIGTEIVMQGKLPDGSPIRWIFSGIQPNSFHWSGEKLSGKRWHIYEELWAHRVGT
ncbi:MAG TPA: hypothetical protein VFA71_10555 [Terriglobales bacterium]|nr:hypothetical protein [Terriglobales bacterium]